MTHDGRGKVGDIGEIVDAGGHHRSKAGQTCQTVDLERVAHLVGQQDVGDAVAGEGLGLADLLAADADGAAQFLLQTLHIGGLVHLAMAAQAQTAGADIVAQLADIAFERVEIEQQAGCLDLGLGHAGQGRDVVAELKGGKINGHQYPRSRATSPCIGLPCARDVRLAAIAGARVSTCVMQAICGVSRIRGSLQKG